MQITDWIVLIAVQLFIIIYGIWKTRKTRTATSFISGNTSPWWMVGLSIMATQASAITFLSTPGQAFHEGLGFVQFYFGLPLAMIILSIFVLPKFFGMKVFTAYEYLEQRFGLPTRILTAILFLIQRGLAAGITIFAPAIILSSILGWDLRITNIVIGLLVIVYTVFGGTQAVSQTQKQQMLVILIGMFIAIAMIFYHMPIPFTDSLELAGSMGKLESVSTKFDLGDRYNIWSAMLGGTFLFLSYFGTDQSQVQRYLTGKDLKQARLGLMFNGLLKIPMQFFILFTGVMVFVLFQFVQTPLSFNPVAQQSIENQEVFAPLQAAHQNIETERQTALYNWQQARAQDNPQQANEHLQQLRELQTRDFSLRQQAREQLEISAPHIERNDKDYVFIYYILNYLPAGIIGLLIAVILSAAMSSTASELNALATTTVIDIYKRNFKPHITEQQLLRATRWFTLIWGIIAIFFAVNATLFENLIQAVNVIGSLFYGVILGVFAVAFLLPKVGGKAVLWAIIIVEPLIILLYILSQKGLISLEFLWLNPIGCLLLMLVAYLLQQTPKLAKA
ncbi:MAG: sodium:solute symporter [Weeksellaceae bacterium]|nr:sodium:solute symporter [Weeksellaceae bacterium]